MFILLILKLYFKGQAAITLNFLNYTFILPSGFQIIASEVNCLCLELWGCSKHSGLCRSSLLLLFFLTAVLTHFPISHSRGEVEGIFENYVARDMED